MQGSAENVQVRHGDDGLSLHYVGPDGAPIDVRTWYRFWVVSSAIAAVLLVVGLTANRHLAGFKLGAVEGALVDAVSLGMAQGWAWAMDLRHRHKSRDYWVRRNDRSKRRVALASGSVATASLLTLVISIAQRSSHASGVSTALLAGALFVLAALGDAARLRSGGRR